MAAEVLSFSNPATGERFGEVAMATPETVQLQASAVIINDSIAQFGVPLLPFGGIKESGFGRTHGQEGLMQFTRPYSYVVGKPPLKWDVATVLREPGHYNLGAAIMELAFGATLRQRWDGLTRLVGRRRPAA